MSVSAVGGFAVTGPVQKLDSGMLKVSKATPEMMERMAEAEKNRFRIPLGKADNDPGNIYATVKVNGQVVATLYNSGSAETSNATYGRTRNLPSMTEAETRVGPELAQKRAEEIAAKMGGTIEKSSSAQTQAQWQNRPAMEWTYDYAAMEAARTDRDARNASAGTLVAAQIMGQIETG